MDPAEIAEAFTGITISVFGAVAVALAARRRGRDQALRWFGVFLLLYGVRLLATSEVSRELLVAPEWIWRQTDAFVTYAILAPTLLFVDRAFGPGWKQSIRWAWKIEGVYAAGAMAFDLVTGQPGAAMVLNAPAVFLAVGVSLFNFVVFRQRIRWTRDLVVVAIGVAIFGAVAGYETLTPLTGLPRSGLEPVAMLVMIGCIGFFVAEQVFSGERRLAAIAAELETARRVQESILPRALPQVPGLRMAARYRPAAAIAGDFYDFLPVADEGVGILVADVCGHGVPAALIASMVKVAIAAQAGHADDPARVLDGMNRVLLGKFDRSYVTAIYAVVQPRHQRLVCARAGHPPALLCRSGRVAQVLGGGLMLATFSGARYQNTELGLEPADRLLLYTDGISEAMNHSDEPFGEERLCGCLQATTDLPADDFADLLLEKLTSWTGGPRDEPHDDLTMVVVDFG